MLTRNFYNVIKWAITSGRGWSASYRGVPISVTCTDGTVLYTGAVSTYSSQGGIFSAWKQTNATYGARPPSVGQVLTSYEVVSGIAFGDGDTEPDINDIKLSGNIISGLTATSINVSVNNSQNGLSMICQYVLENNTNESITIREYGVFGTARPNENQADTGIYMAAHGKLNSALTLNPGELKTLILNIEII